MGWFDDRIPLFNNEGDKMETVDVKALAIEQVELDQLRKTNEYWMNEVGRVQGQLIDLVDEFYEQGADAENIIEAICEIVDYNPVKEVSFTATVRVDGRIEIPAGEDVDEYLSQIEFNVDSNNFNVVIDNTYPESIEEN